MLGCIIGNRYEILELIGEGGSGIVYKAVDIEKGVNTAIKFMKEKAVSAYIEDYIRFKKEMEIISKFDHPGIVRMLDRGDYESKPFLVTEYLEGNTLSDLLQREKIISCGKIIKIVRQLTETLNYVHVKGVLHRDIKPGNIFIVGEGDKISAKLLDFGISNIMEFREIRKDDRVTGTFGYMSPEASGILNRRVDERSDLYSLGAVMYHMLTGNQPFKANDPGSLLHQQASIIPFSPKEVRADINSTLSDITMKLLSKDPDLRYQSANGLLHDLLRCEKGEAGFEIALNDQKIKLTYQTGLIGRESEMEKLKEMFHRSKRENGGICFISGDAGIGKSRLAEEFTGYVYGQGGMLIKGRCLNHSYKAPYQPFKDAIDEYIRVIEQYDDKDRAEEICRLEKKFGSLGELIVSFNPRLAKFMNIRNKLIPLDPERENRRFLMVLSDFFCTLAQSDTVCVLYIDDLQWADEDSLNLLEEILGKINNSNLLVIATYRDGGMKITGRLETIKNEAEKRGCATVIKLPPLRYETLNKLIACILRDKEEKYLWLTGYILEKSGGNPFFAINLLRELVENRAVLRHEHKWKENREKVKQLPLPGSILDAFLKKAEALTVEQGELLQKAAVMGREFDIYVLYRLTDMDQEKIIGTIDELIAMHMLEKGTERGKLLFVHDRIRDAFYERNQKDELMRVHLNIACALEQINTDREGVLFELAHHYIKGGDSDKALEYVIPAAQKAKSAYANDEAIRFYIAALELLDSKGLKGYKQWLEVNQELVDVYLTTGSNDNAIAIAQSILPLIDNPIQKAAAYKKIGIAYFKKGDWVKSEENLIQGIEFLGEKIPVSKIETVLSLFKELLVHFTHILFLRRQFKNNGPVHASEHNKEIIWTYTALGWSYMLSDVKKVTRCVLRNLNLSESKMRGSRELGACISAYGAACMTIPMFKTALKYHQKALKLRQEMCDEWGVAQCLQFIGFNYLWSGMHDESIKAFETARDLFEKMGDIWEYGMVVNGLLEVYHYISDYDNCINYAKKYLQVSSKTKDYFGANAGKNGFAFCYIEKGDFEEAEALLNQTKAFSLENKIWFSYCFANILSGYLELERGNYDKAIESLEKAKKINRENMFIKDYTVLLYPLLADSYIKKYKCSNLRPRAKDKKNLHSLCREALKRTKSWPNHYGTALRVAANMYAFEGKTTQAHKLYNKSIMFTKKINRRYELAKSYYEYTEFLNLTCRPEEAKYNFYNAYQIFREIGAGVYIKKCENITGFYAVSLSSDGESRVSRLKSKMRMNAILNTGRFISSILDIDRLLEKILESVMGLIGAERGILMLYPKNPGGGLEIKALRNVSRQDIGTQFTASRSIIEKVEKERLPLLISDALAEEAFNLQESVVFNCIRSVICVPVISKNTMLGVIYLDNSLLGGLFDEEDLEVVDCIASQAGISIENAMLYNELEIYSKKVEEAKDRLDEWNRILEQSVLEQKKQLGDVSRELSEKNEELNTINWKLKEYASAVEELAVAKERNRVAGDIHDTLGHTLTLMVYLLETAKEIHIQNPRGMVKKIDEVLDIARKGLKEVEQSISGLYTDNNDSPGLAELLEGLAEDFSISGMNVEVSVNDADTSLPPDFQDIICKICREAITNSLRHGRATEVNIVVSAKNGLLKLLVTDNGAGCKKIEKGLGLQSMQQRIEELKGIVNFYSNDGEGFNVYAEIPV